MHKKTISPWHFKEYFFINDILKSRKRGCLTIQWQGRLNDLLFLNNLHRGSIADSIPGVKTHTNPDECFQNE